MKNTIMTQSNTNNRNLPFDNALMTISETAFENNTNMMNGTKFSS